MFSILFIYLFITLAKKTERVTVDGAYILTPVIGDCWIVFQVLELFK
jgi:hypothetical protein